MILQDAETATKSEAGTTQPKCEPTLPLGKSKSGGSGFTRSVVICEGERERVTGCETVGDVLAQLTSIGIDGDYLTNG